MAILDILHYPDERLHKIAQPVVAVDDRIKQLVKDMAETMYEAPGIGLAATQVNVHKRVIVIDISEDRSGLMALINPEILERDGAQGPEEGCLAVPGIYEKVTRAERGKVRALNEKGESFEFEADDLLAVCVQHEIDHLDGKLFIDHLSSLKRDRAIKKYDKLRKQGDID